MAYTIVPTAETGDLWTAANHNAYLRDNFAASVPDIITTKGDLAAGNGIDGAARVGVGSNGRGLTLDAAEATGIKWGNTAIPLGAIILWYGSVVSVPSGWALCDGNNGTPDLRGRFVIGAGGSYNPNDTGGAATHTHTQGNTGSENSHTHTQGNVGSESSHTHTQGNTGSESSHTHSVSFTSATSPSAVSVDITPVVWTPSSIGHTHGWSGSTQTTNHSHTNPDTNAGSSHLHTNPTLDAGSAHAHTNPTTASSSTLGPYHALVYIMRVS